MFLLLSPSDAHFQQRLSVFNACLCDVNVILHEEQHVYLQALSQLLPWYKSFFFQFYPCFLNLYNRGGGCKVRAHIDPHKFNNIRFIVKCSIFTVLITAFLQSCHYILQSGGTIILPTRDVKGLSNHCRYLDPYTVSISCYSICAIHDYQVTQVQFAMTSGHSKSFCSLSCLTTETGRWDDLCVWPLCVSADGQTAFCHLLLPLLSDILNVDTAAVINLSVILSDDITIQMIWLPLWLSSYIL